VVDDPLLKQRLLRAKSEHAFEQCLGHVFGERHAQFSPQLRRDLFTLWELGLALGPPHCREYEGSNGPGGFGRFPPELIFDRESAESNPAGVPVTRARENTQTYPAKVGSWSPECPASSERNTTRPACPSCGGGRGMGDYPFPCDTCGGSGNAGICPGCSGVGWSCAPSTRCNACDGTGLVTSGGG
jgi:hypothetical protein